MTCMRRHSTPAPHLILSQPPTSSKTTRHSLHPHQTERRPIKGSHVYHNTLLLTEMPSRRVRSFFNSKRVVFSSKRQGRIVWGKLPGSYHGETTNDVWPVFGFLTKPSLRYAISQQNLGGTFEGYFGQIVSEQEWQVTVKEARRKREVTRGALSIWLSSRECKNRKVTRAIWSWNEKVHAPPREFQAADD
jgi:hypothetical protein